MKEKIISMLGNNHLDPIQFEETQEQSEIYGLYTFEGGVFIFRDNMDINFDDLKEEEQKIVTEMVESKKWIINPTLQ
jgi:hypothetical protein